jgi:hypothetical protein
MSLQTTLSLSKFLKSYCQGYWQLLLIRDQKSEDYVEYNTF